ncbi:MAG TPA: DUF4166 domain-containing protein [Dokdonella sp.]|uniref:DUF4166 domain-containing protein n=1 Tax=Dokdonella sp. TaxID=2291710 RepID=UPI002D180581|nr:DUF4166 domain-containing protein [Dokdonella sp.]HUD40958.1 DUF4166 domain-containing protein [Dokdonella sp.]
MRASGPLPERADAGGGTRSVPPLWPQLLGAAALSALPTHVRRLHQDARPCRYAGSVVVERGCGRAARLAAAVLRLPPAGAHALQVEIAADARGERWSRRFGAVPVSSRLAVRDGRLIERIGLATLGFRIAATPDGLHWRAESLSIAGIALPRRRFDVAAREYERDDRYHFEVAVRLAPFGLLIAYAGSLDVD